MKFSIKYFFRKCDPIRRKLRIWSYLLKKFLMEKFIVYAMSTIQLTQPLTDDLEKQTSWLLLIFYCHLLFDYYISFSNKLRVFIFLRVADLFQDDVGQWSWKVNLNYNIKFKSIGSKVFSFTIRLLLFKYFLHFNSSHFKPTFHFFTHWKRLETKGFLNPSQGIEMENWLEMDQFDRTSAESYF